MLSNAHPHCRAPSNSPVAQSKRHSSARSRAILAFVTILACAALALSSRAFADSIYWQGTTGDWFTAANWSDHSQPNGQGGYLNIVPGPTDGVQIYNGGTAQIAGGSAGAQYLYIDVGSALSLNGALTTSYEYVGYSGSGTFAQASGSNLISGGLYLGDYSGSTGSYNLSGTGALNASYEYVGWSGAGTFTQTGGTNFISSELYLGEYSGSTGSYALSGTGSLTANYEFVGDYLGNGGFTQTGGRNFISSGLYLGGSSGGTGTNSYALSGTGSLTASYEYVGDYGSGTFTQSGGTHTISGVLYLGHNSGSTGSYNLNGTGSLTVNGSEYVGDSGAGTFTQTGGTHTVNSSSLYFGYYSGSSGSYALSSTGSLSVSASEYVGYTGAGTFTQTGGTHTVSNSLYLGYNTGSTGVFNLSSTGSLNVRGTEYVGYTGGGTFTQGGGTHTINGSLYVGYNTGSSGSYSLQSGSLAAANEFIGAGSMGTFTQTGGTNTVSGTLSVAANASYSSGTYNLQGGSLTAGTIQVYTGGTLTLGVNNAINSASNLVVNGGTFAAGSFSNTVAGVQLVSGSITGTGGVVTSATDFGLQSGTVSAILAGAVGLTKTTNGTVILSGGNTYTGATTISAGTLQLGDGTNGHDGSVAGTSIVDNAALVFNTFAIQSTSLIVSGTGSLSKLGPGTLVLAGANLYTGPTVISAGTVQLGAPNALPAGAALSVSGGALDLHGFSQPIASLSNGGAATGAITNSSGIVATLTVNQTTITNFGGAISGNLGLTVPGTGTLVISGANTYTGATAINAGALIATSASAVGTGAVTVASGATFDYFAVTDNPLVLASTLTLNAPAGIGTSIGGSTTSGRIAVTGAVIASGSNIPVNIHGIKGTTPTTGTYTLVSAAGGLTGATYQLGAVKNNTNFTITPGSLSGTAAAITVGITSATPLTAAYWKGGLTGNPNVWAASNGSTASNWTTDAAGTVATALIPGAGATVTFSATGATNQGSMVLGDPMSITGMVVTDATPIALTNDGNTLTLGGGGLTVNTGANVTLATPVALGASQTWSNNSGNTLTIAGNLTNSGASQTLTVNGSSPVWVSGNVYLSEAAGTGRAVTINGSGATTITGVIADYNGIGTAGSLLYSGAGTLTLTAVNTYTGPTTVNSGALILGDTSALGGGALNLHGGTIQASIAGISLANAVSLSASSTISGANALTLAGAFTNSGGNYTLTNNITGASLLLAGNVYLSEAAGTGRALNFSGSGTTTVNGVIADSNPGGAAGSLIYSGTGTLILTNVNSYTGTTTINGGTLQLGDGTYGHDGSVASASITDSAILAFNTYAVQSSSAVISGSGGLSKTGPGTLTLAGANTYTGGTSVTSGTLNAPSASALGHGALAVSGGTLNLYANITVPTATLSGGTVNTGSNSLVISNQLQTPGYIFTLSGAPSFAVSGSNVGSDSTSRTITLNGGTLTVPSNLVARWNSVTGSALANTVAGSAIGPANFYSGTAPSASGVTVVNDKFGNPDAVQFNGTSGYLQVANFNSSLDFSATSFSTSMWVKYNNVSNASGGATPSQWSRFWSDKSAWNGATGWDIQRDSYNQSIDFQGVNGASGATVPYNWGTDPSDPNSSPWFLMTMTFSRGATTTATFYMNGTQVGQITGLANIQQTANAFWIGAGPDAFPNPADLWSGKVSDIRLYNTALTTAQVSSMYNGGAGDAGAPSVALPNTAIAATAGSTLNFGGTSTLGDLTLTGSGTVLTLGTSMAAVTFNNVTATGVGNSPGASIAGTAALTITGNIDATGAADVLTLPATTLAPTYGYLYINERTGSQGTVTFTTAPTLAGASTIYVYGGNVNTGAGTLTVGNNQALYLYGGTLTSNAIAINSGGAFGIYSTVANNTPVSVSSGATIGGYGSISGVTTINGTVGFGSGSLTNLTVNNALNFGGSDLWTVITNSSYDQVHVNGNLSVAGSPVLLIDAALGTASPLNQTYILMTYSGTLLNSAPWTIDYSRASTSTTDQWVTAGNGTWDNGSNWSALDWSGGSISYATHGQITLSGLTNTNKAPPLLTMATTIAPVSGNNVTVTGPANPGVVQSLTIGDASAQTAALTLQSGGPLTVTNALTVASNGRFTGTGTGAAYDLMAGSIASAGTVTVGNASVTGAVTITGGTFSATTLTAASIANDGLMAMNGGGFAATGNETHGAAGSGQFTQLSGSHNVGGNLILGASAQSAGTFSLQGGTVNVAGYEYVGFYGSGTITQTGGTHTVNNTLYVGDYAGSYGSYALSGTGSLTASYEYVGYYGSGTFTQIGGTHTVNNTLYVGDYAGSTGFYNLSGTGTLAASYEYVGLSGAGTFTQTGGTHTVNNTLYVGDYSGSTGSYNLSGTGTLATSYEYVGLSGAGTFTQTGGTDTVSNSLYVGYYSGSSGSWTLSDAGSLTVNGSEYVGNTGSGTFTQSAGTHTIIGNLYLGNSSGSTGAYALSGSGVLSASNAYIGGSSSGSGATGTFSQAGGAAAISGALTLWNNASRLNLSSGSLTAGTINVLAGTFSQTGGTLRANGPVIVSGGSFTQANGSFTSSGNFTVTGSGMVTLSGNTTVANATFTGGGSVNAGTSPLLVTTSFNSGSLAFNWTAGAGAAVAVSGSNLSDDSAARTLTLTGGTLAMQGGSGNNIAVHFAGYGNNTTSPITGTDGVVSNAHWNNLATGYQSGNGSNLVNSSNVATTAAVTSNGWWYYYFGTSPTELVLQGPGGSGNGTINTVAITGIPYSNYEIIAYVNDYYTGIAQTWLSSAPATSYYNSFTTTTSNSFIQITNTTAGVYPSGNYIIFPGLTTASQTINISDVDGIQQNKGIVSFQVIDTTPIGMILPATSVAVTSNSAMNLVPGSNNTLGGLALTNSQLTVNGGTGLTFAGAVGASGTSSVVLGGSALSLTGSNLDVLGPSDQLTLPTLTINPVTGTTFTINSTGLGTAVFGGNVTLGTSRTLVLAGGITRINGTVNGGNGVSMTGTAALASDSSGTVGALVISGNGAITGGTINAATTTVNSTSVLAVNSATLNTSGTASVAGTLRVTGSGQVSATGGIIVNGLGARFLASSSLPVTSTITLTQGTLGGTGTISPATGTTTIGTGAIISPGNTPNTMAPGTLSITGGLTFASGGTYQFKLNNATGVAGTNWDVLSVAGGLTISASSGSPFTIDLNGLNATNAIGVVPAFNATTSYNWEILTGNTPLPADLSGLALTLSNFTTLNSTTASYFSLAPGDPSFDAGATPANNLWLRYIPFAGPNQWRSVTGGDWSFAANWYGSVPNGVDAIARLWGFLTSGSVNVASAFTVGTLSFNNTAASYTITASGSGSVALQTSTGNASIQFEAGDTQNHFISAPLILASNTNLTLGSNSLTLSGALTWGNTSAIAATVVSGTLNLDPASGTTPSVYAGSSLQIDSSASVNAGGAADPFSDGVHQVAVVNSSATGLNILSGSKTLASLAGTGNATVAGGATLTILGAAAQGQLSITGTLNAGSTVTATGLLGIHNGGVLQGTGGAGSFISTLAAPNLTIDSGGSAYLGTLSGASAVTVNGDLYMNSALALTSSATLTGSGTVHGNVALSGGIITLGTTGDIAGSLSGTGGAWSGQGSVAGTTTVSGGNLVITGSMACQAFTVTTGGTVTQSGNSMNTVPGTLTVGDGSGGTYNLQGGALTASAIQINAGGAFAQTTGTLTATTFTQAGGAATFSGKASLAVGTGNVVTYNMQGGTLNAAVQVNSGGTFNQSGNGTVTGDLTVTGTAQAPGQYFLSDTGSLVGGATIGNSGVGTFTQSGGTHTVNGWLYLGDGSAGSNGIYNLQNGGLTAQYEIIAYCSTGTFTQTGGTHAVTSFPLLIGYGFGSNGSYNLQNGSLSVSEELIGSAWNLPPVGLFPGTGPSPTGTFTQTGGTHNVSSLDIASDSSSKGTYNLQGGALNAQWTSLGIGGSFNQTAGTLYATDFAQDGGTATFSGNAATLTVGPGNVGSYELAGGSLTAGAIQVNPGGTFTQTAGTLAATTFTQTGGTVTFSGNATTLTVGTGGVVTCNLQGGTLTAGAVVVNTGGTFTNSATLTLTGAANSATPTGGTFTQNAGGTLDVQINGADNGQYGQLVVGAASLAGTLNVTLGNAFVATSGSTYQILSSSSLTGAFNNGAPIIDALSASGSASSILFRVTYSNSGVSLQETTGQSAIWAQPQSGNWPTAANWVQSVVPAATTDTYFMTGSSTPYTVSLTNASAAQSLTVQGDSVTLALGGNTLMVGGALTVDGVGGQIGTLVLSGPGSVSAGGGVTVTPLGSLTVSGANVTAASVANDGLMAINGGTFATTGDETHGVNGAGQITQTAGTHTVSGSLYLGANAGSSGTYTQSGGTNTVTALYVGSGMNAIGSYSLSGTGALNAANETIGSWYDTGTFTQSAGTANTIGTSLYVGNWGNGSYIQNGGQTTIAGYLFLAANPGSTGSYALSGTGILSASSVGLGGWNSSSPGGTGTLSISGGTVTVSSSLNLWKDSSQVNLSNGSLRVGTLNVYAGAFTQTGGTSTISNTLYLGNNAGSTGSYALSGTGSITVNGNECVGYWGTGSFIQSAGTHTVNGSLYLSRYVGSAGSYTLSGSAALSVPNTEYIGYEANGVFTQSGGSNSAGYECIGSGNSAVASYIHTDGTNTLTGCLYVGAGASTIGPTVVGAYSLSGTGILNAYSEIVGNWYDTGTFTQSSGTNTVGYQVIVGNWGNGSYTQTGGQTTITQYLLLADEPGFTGSYTLSGSGALTTGYEGVGDAGSGSFVQTGGTNIVSGGLNELDVGGLSTGSYALSGTGSLTVHGNEYVGGDVGGSGTGTFTQSDNSTHTVMGTLTLAANAGSNGTYNLQGGTLSAGAIQINTGGTFNQTDGALATATFTQAGGAATFSGNAATLAIGTGNVVTYNLQGGSLNAGSIVVNSGGTLAQSGNSTNTVTGTLAVGDGSGGTYSLQGGVLTAGAVVVNTGGTFTNSATLTLTGAANSATPTGGTFTQNAGGTLDVQINGADNGQYGQLVVGAASLAGTLNVTLGNAFVATSGSTYQILSSSSLTGAFNNGAPIIDALSASGSASSILFRVTYSNSGVSLQETTGQSAIWAQPQSGNWPTAANWVQSVVPAATTDTYFMTGSSTPYTVSLTNASAAQSLTVQGDSVTLALGGNTLMVGGALTVDGVGGQTGSLTIVGTGAMTNAGGIAVTSYGTLTLNSGNVSTASVANDGIITINGGTFTTTGNEIHGNTGFGQVLQTAGTHTVTGTLTLAANTGSNGTYSLQGGTLATGAIIVHPGGTFTQTGGSLNATTITQTGGAATLAELTLTASGGGGNAVTYSLSGGILSTPTLTLSAGGTFSQTGGTLNAATITQVGGTATGTLQNQGTFTYTSGTFSGRLLNQGTVSFGPSFTAANGMENDTTVTVAASQTITLQGTGLDNEGSLTVSGGALSVGGSFTNNGTLVQSGGSIIYTGSTAFKNAVGGSLNLSTVGLFKITGAGGLTNDGLLNLGGSTISAWGMGAGVINDVGGVISGPGRITVPFANSGTVVVPVGSLQLPAFTNNGLVQLQALGALLTGGAIANYGTVQGAGQINNFATNEPGGTIEALGGTLALTAPLTNSPGGLLAASNGTKLTLSGGFTGGTNAGIISLAGGTVDTGTNTFTNTGQITGYGILRGAGLTNNGAVTFGGGTTTVNCPVTNSAGRSITVLYQPAFFTANVVNNGAIKATGTTATFTGTYSGSGTYTSDPASNYFYGAVTIAPGGSFTGGVGDQFFMLASFSNAGSFTMNGGNTQVSMVTNSGTFTQTGGTFTATGDFTNSAGATATIGGAQNWSPGTHLYAEGGTVNLNSDAGSASSRTLSIITSGVGTTINFGSTEHLAALSIGAGTTVALAAGGGAFNTQVGTMTNSGSFTQTSGTFTATGDFTNTTGATATIGGVQTWAPGTHLYAQGGTVTLDSDAGSTSSRTLSIVTSGPGTIVNLDATEHLAALTIGAGTKVTLAAGVTSLVGGALTTGKVLVTDGLSLSGSGQLDLTNNALIFKNAGTVGEDEVLGLLASGWANGAWNGPGLVSSLAAGDSSHHALGYALGSELGAGYTIDGETVGASDVVVAFTFAGDSTLAGSTSLLGFNAVLNHIGSNGDWYNGGFTYDTLDAVSKATVYDGNGNPEPGAVSFPDFSAVLNNIGSHFGDVQPLSPGSAPVPGAPSVPEPTSLGLLAVGAMALLGRRRHGG